MSEGLRKITDCAVHALGEIAEIKTYRKHWGEKFCVEQAEKCFGQVMEHLKDFDFKALTLDELKQAGFRMWDENLLLCPLWAADLLLPHIEDRDIRFGCLAYGWPVVDGKVVWEKSNSISGSEETK